MFVFKKAGLQNIMANLRSMDLRFFLLSSLIYVGIVYLAALRWSLLLEGKHPVKKLFSLCLIGSFFNNLLPGAIGGDAVKAYYLFRETNRGESIASVFMDRYVGYLALLSIGLVSGIFAFHDLESVRMQWISTLLFVSFLAGSLVVFGMRFGRRFAAVSDFYDYFHKMIRNRGKMSRCFLLSLLIQACSIFSIYLISRGMGQRPPFAALFVFVPIIITVMMIPISISGLGLRESAFVVLFGLSGIPPEASTSISFLWFLSIASASLLGAVEYVRYRRSAQGVSEPETLSDDNGA